MTFKADSLNHYFKNTTSYNDICKEKMAKALSNIVQCPTVAFNNQDEIDKENFYNLHKTLEKDFPLVAKTLQKTVINELSLLYFWPGSDPSLKPVLFMAHEDVVPVMPGTEEDWAYPAYSGEIAEGFVWGRGSSDCKGLLICEISAAEYLIEKGFKPKRGIYLAFGHDEEVLGDNGAVKIVEHLKSQGVELEFVMDEGGGLLLGDNYGAPGKLLAKVDVFEKGYTDISLKVNSKGGHSSRPGKGTALGKVAKAIVALEENQFPPQISSVAKAMFEGLSACVTEEPLKTYFSDVDKYAEEITAYCMENQSLAPLLHTTTAATMINGSPAPNVLPQVVEAAINFRLAPQDSVQDVLNHCIEAVNDSEVEVSVIKGKEPSGIAKVESYGMEILKAAAEEFYNVDAVIPGLVMGGTDACYYEEVCDCCYRFSPHIDSLALSSTIHGTDERVSIDSLYQMLKFVTHVMKTAAEN